MARTKKTTMSDMPQHASVGRYKPTKEDEARERRYRAEDALRTLSRAEEIRSDRGLMRDVKSHAKDQIKAVSRVLGKPSARGSK